MNKLITLMMLGTMLHAVEVPKQLVPDWVLIGILKTETRSYYDDNFILHYIDKRRGSSGERGPFQMTRRAFKQIARKGDQFWRIETDTHYAEEMAIRYLMWLNEHYGEGDWHRNVEMYNAGPNKHSRIYLSKVIKNGFSS